MQINSAQRAVDRLDGQAKASKEGSGFDNGRGARSMAKEQGFSERLGGWGVPSLLSEEAATQNATHERGFVPSGFELVQLFIGCRNSRTICADEFECISICIFENRREIAGGHRATMTAPIAEHAIVKSELAFEREFEERWEIDEGQIGRLDEATDLPQRGCADHGRDWKREREIVRLHHGERGPADRSIIGRFLRRNGCGSLPFYDSIADDFGKSGRK